MDTVPHSRSAERPSFLLPVALLSLFVTVLSACGMPAQMQVRSGVDPQYQDDDVRFRTTYYFRVFRRCAPTENKKQPLEPMVDSLYRFRMTGKAPSSTTKVHFESGTLLAKELDPYGVMVRTAKDIQKNTQTEPKPDKPEAANDTKRFTGADPTTTTTNIHPATMAKTETKTETSITDATGGEKGSSVNVDRAMGKACPEGYRLQHGFQIWGPEGWREFNQDERLIMAMSTTAEPLISSLQRVARMQRAAAGGAEIYLLVGEQLTRTDRAVEAVEGCKEDQSVTACLDGVLKRYKGE